MESRSAGVSIWLFERKTGFLFGGSQPKGVPHGNNLKKKLSWSLIFADLRHFPFRFEFR